MYLGLFVKVFKCHSLNLTQLNVGERERRKIELNKFPILLDYGVVWTVKKKIQIQENFDLKYFILHACTYVLK